MRYSSHNRFSYNVWAQAPLHMLENDNNGNAFFYDRFEGRVFVGNRSVGNRFELSEFVNPTGICLSVDTLNATYVYKSYFRSCSWDVFLVTSAPVTLDRSVATLAKVSEGVTIGSPVARRTSISTPRWTRTSGAWSRRRWTRRSAAPTGTPRPTSITTAKWTPTSTSSTASPGPCAADLAVASLTNPPAVAVPGTSISVTNTVRNNSGFAAGSSRAQYYLSLDQLKNSGDKLLGGRNVGALTPGGESTATVSVTIPANTLLGSYFLLACADDTGLLLESNEADNCRASTTKVQVGRPDLVMTALGSPPPAVALGGYFPVRPTP